MEVFKVSWVVSDQVLTKQVLQETILAMAVLIMVLEIIVAAIDLLPVRVSNHATLRSCRKIPMITAISRSKVFIDDN